MADRARPTTVKTRIIAGIQQVVRFDEESSLPLSPEAEGMYRKAFLESLPQAQSLALSDYGKGVLARGLCRFLISEARARNIPVVVDPKGADYSLYAGASLVTPNRQELSLAVGEDVSRASSEAMAKAGLALMRRHSLDNLLITRSEDGMTLITSEGEIRHLPTEARAVFDVSGAGDTVVAAMAAALACGESLFAGAKLAALAAGIVVGKVGTATASPDEIRTAYGLSH
jgi:D-beta-D-heptose 7-phosphate kinase/D-beta-D-heptose 1-phosphate adenosyltransferase